MRQIGFNEGRVGEPFVDAQMGRVLCLLTVNGNISGLLTVPGLDTGDRPVDEVIGDAIIPVIELAGEKETVAAEQQ
jgi:hypothetical protein